MADSSIIAGQPTARGTTTFTWLERGAFLVQHADADPPLPTAPPEWLTNSPFPLVTIIALDDASGTFCYAYADARGVRRVYQMRLSDGVWEIWGQAGPEFYQRFRGTFSQDGNTITSRWERSRDGSTWERDFDGTYAKVR